jgi:hypothetical protein
MPRSARGSLEPTRHGPYLLLAGAAAELADVVEGSRD